MGDAISASVLRSVLRDVKTRRESAHPSDTVGAARAAGSLFADTQAQLLATLPPSELALLQSASALVHRNAVKRVTAQPSQRSFFRVESLNRYHARDGDGDVLFDTGADVSTSAISQPFDGAMVRGPNYYNVFAHYCSCQSFHEQTAVQCSTAMCKHMLAALLADATGQCQRIEIQDTDFATMLCAQLDATASLHDRSV